jgi:hypothetical protein
MGEFLTSHLRPVYNPFFTPTGKFRADRKSSRLANIGLSKFRSLWAGGAYAPKNDFLKQALNI